MSILVVGASHHSAPVHLLERLALDESTAAKVRAAALDMPHVNEVAVLATCNRVELYAEVDRFHGGVEDLTALLVDRADAGADEVTAGLYVHFDTGAVSHLFRVAAGLESMVVGESQILGQVRDALRQSQSDESVGASLNALFQQALRVGKRTHAETGIDRAGQSVVSVALDRAERAVGGLRGARTCIVGSGSMAALCATSLRRKDVGDIVVCSRTPANAHKLATRVSAHTADMADLHTAMSEADLVVTCTGANGTIVGSDLVRRAVAPRRSGHPLVVADLAMPRDVDPAVAEVDEVSVISLSEVAEAARSSEGTDDITAADAIVEEEVAAFSAARDATRVAPTVVALRSMATDVVAAELDRLWGRLDDLSPQQQEEVANTVRRVAEKLLHEPTVRMKRFAGRSPESSYADALAELFALDPGAVAAVTKEQT